MKTAHWVRVIVENVSYLGKIRGDRIELFAGDLFGEQGSSPTPRATRVPPQPLNRSIELKDAQFDLPCQPTKFIGLWNNYHAQATKQGLAIPTEPLYFLKPSSSFCTGGAVIQSPSHYAGRVIYEAELGIVIGQTCKSVSEPQAEAVIFGYTCVNDFTALDLISKDTSFAQWTRAKGFDGFGAFGPVIATGLDPMTLNVRALINGRERQNYPCADMIFSPAMIVSLLSQEMTLYPGDIIACGTSLGVLPMRSGTQVDVIIDGIGCLSNTYHSATLDQPT